MPDGRPQVTPVWVDFDGEHVIFNSAKGRQKDRNVRRDPARLARPHRSRKSLPLSRNSRPRGRNHRRRRRRHINKLAKKYLGVDKYPYGQPGEIRVIYKIKPEHTTVMG